jgi:hypothetical protein
MVAPQDGDSTPILYFQQQDVEEGFHAIEAAIHIVAHEQIVRILNQSRSTGSFPQISKI